MKNKIDMITTAEANGIPTFVLKATDKHTLPVLKQYLHRVIDDPAVTHVFKQDLLGIVESFQNYQFKKAPFIKSPD